MSADGRACEVCDSSLSRRDGERPSHFRVRRTCSKSCAAKLSLAAKYGKQPHSLGGRTVVAMTCRGCGLLLEGSSFQKYPRSGWATTCFTCKRRKQVGTWTEDQRREYNRAKSAVEVRANQVSRDAARRHGQDWTGPELEILARGDLSASRAAVMTGRTISAVKSARHRLRVEPAYDRLSGGSHG